MLVTAYTKIFTSLTTIGLTLLLSIDAFSQSIPAKTSSVINSAKTIATRTDRSDKGFIDSVVDVTMTLKTSRGEASERKLKISTLEKPDESVGDKTLIVFTWPRNINGTALLSHSKILVSDDQWIFLPSIRRVKRISSSNKAGPFVGSEFAFEDFTALELNKFEYSAEREIELNGVMVDVITCIPLYSDSGYSSQVRYIDKENYQILKIEFFDKKETLLKTLTANDYRLYSNNIWRPHVLEMVNHQTGRSTIMSYEEFRFDNDLSNADFTRGALQRVR